MNPSRRARILLAMLARLSGIPGNPAYMRGGKVRKVLRYRARRVGSLPETITGGEETIKLLAGSGSTAPGEAGAPGSNLKKLTVFVEWHFFGDVEDADIDEAEHDLEKALWTYDDELSILVQRGMEASDQSFIPKDSTESEVLDYTVTVTYSTLLGDPTKG